MRFLSVAFSCVALFSLQATMVKADAPVPHWSISGTSILDPKGQPIRLHGFDVCWWVPPTEQDAIDVRQLGANCVRYMFGYDPKGTYDPTQIDEVEQQIHNFTRHGIWVIPVLYKFETPNSADPKHAFGPWNTPKMNQEFLAMWTDLISRMKSEPYIGAWEPMNEPHDADAAAVAAWYRAIIPQFRQLDPDRPIVVEGSNYSHAEDLTDQFKMEHTNIIYAFHFYDPWNYTTEIQNPPLDYPGPWGKSYLEKTISPAILFRERYQVPVWCGEWGVKTGAPHYDLWVRDVFDILQTNHFDWCIWAWALQPKDPKNLSFDINKDKPETYQLFADRFASLKSAPTGSNK